MFKPLQGFLGFRVTFEPVDSLDRRNLLRRVRKIKRRRGWGPALLFGRCPDCSRDHQHGKHDHREQGPIAETVIVGTAFLDLPQGPAKWFVTKLANLQRI